MKNIKQYLPRSLNGLFISGLLAVVLPSQAWATELVNLLTSEAGMHRISHQQLVSQGVDLSGVRHRRLSLSADGEPVAIRTKGQDSKKKKQRALFGSGGYIEFYADAADSQYTDKIVYTLHLDRKLRKNIRIEKHKFKKKAPTASDYRHTTLVEEPNYYDFLAPSKTDPWHYGQIFGAGAVTGPTYNFTLDNVVGNTADLSVQVYGIVDIPTPGVNDHHPEIVVNGTPVVDQQFDGSTIANLNATDVPVNNGANTLRVDLKGIAGMPFDALALNQFALTYTRASEVVNDHLEGGFAAGQAQVSGLSSNQQALVYRKDGNTITRITGGRKLGGKRSGFNTGDGGQFIVVGASGFKTPGVAMINDLDDITTGPAEYLIITHSLFQGADLDALVQLRQADYSVKVVDVEQIYGQFGNHVPSADAIHAYVKYAAANMQTRFVALIGSDTYDYKNYVSNSVSFIPTIYASTPGGFLIINQTPSDAKYGDLDDDDVPDIPVGRISARTPAELAVVVEKIRDYQARVGYSGRILIAADKEDLGNEVNFTEDALAVIGAIPQAEWRNAVMGPNRDGWRIFPDLDGDQNAHDKLITALNAGVSVAAYIGHSSQGVWARTTPFLFSASDVSSLTNIDKPALVTQWGCWNTYFVDPAGNSMGDQLLVSGVNGAVAVLGASTLTTSNGERALGIQLSQRMYQQGVTIGEAIIQAKQAMAQDLPDATDILLGWQILGDPALVVSP